MAAAELHILTSSGLLQFGCSSTGFLDNHHHNSTCPRALGLLLSDLDLTARSGVLVLQIFHGVIYTNATT